MLKKAALLVRRQVGGSTAISDGHIWKTDGGVGLSLIAHHLRQEGEVHQTALERATAVTEVEGEQPAKGIYYDLQGASAPETVVP